MIPLSLSLSIIVVQEIDLYFSIIPSESSSIVVGGTIVVAAEPCICETKSRSPILPEHGRKRAINGEYTVRTAYVHTYAYDYVNKYASERANGPERTRKDVSRNKKREDFNLILTPVAGRSSDVTQVGRLHCSRRVPRKKSRQRLSA